MESDTEHITELFKKIKAEFSSNLTHIIDRIVDKDDIRLELNGNEIIIDDVEIDTDVIEDALSDVLDDLESVLEERN
jgi:hypothetical protein